LAGKVKEKYPNDVEVETIYSGFMGLGHKGDGLKPPNVAVDGETLGGRVTFADLEEVVLEKLEAQKNG